MSEHAIYYIIGCFILAALLVWAIRELSPDPMLTKVGVVLVVVVFVIYALSALGFFGGFMPGRR